MALDPDEDSGFDAMAGENVGVLRRGSGMTQTELAEAVSERGIPFRQQTIVKIEKGQRPLRLREADAIAAALGVDLAALVDERPGFNRTAVLVRAVNLCDNTLSELS